MGKWTEAARLVRKAMDTAGAALSDETALSAAAIFPMWASSTAYSVGDRVQYGGVLYKCVQAHTSQLDWIPSVTPALWTAVSVDEYPEWVQPTGSQDAYSKGDKVSYEGKHYQSTVDANVWSPTVYGWEVIE